MVLLKQVIEVQKKLKDIYLHSNMVLLKRRVVLLISCSFTTFTFQYGTTKTLLQFLHSPLMFLYLHSNMVLLKLKDSEVKRFSEY